MAESPRLGDALSTVSHVVISANDDANGILELSAPYVNVSEDVSQLFLSVVRSAGTFGEVSTRIIRTCIWYTVYCKALDVLCYINTGHCTI